MSEILKLGDGPDPSRWYVADARPALPTSEVRDSRFIDPWPDGWRRVEHPHDGWVGLDVVADSGEPVNLDDDRCLSRSFALTFHGEWLPPPILMYLRLKRQFAFGIEGADGMARGIFPHLGGESFRYFVEPADRKSGQALTVPILSGDEGDVTRVDVVGAGRANSLLGAMMG